MNSFINISGKKNIKIVYLGGFYMAEYSLLMSFIENNSEIVFPIDTNDFGKSYHKNFYYNNHSQNKYVFNISDKNLENFLNRYKPDVIIHRYYLDDPIMHYNSYEVAQRLKIPLLKYAMETDWDDDKSCNGDNYDAFLYAHDTKYFLENASVSKKPFYFYPYGVSGFEKILDVPKTKNIGGLGYYRGSIIEREKNLLEYINALKKINEKINVYGSEYDWGEFSEKNHIIINNKFSLEQTVDIINQHKIIVNFESLPNLEGSYSHKIFQSLGCGVPTITRYKKSLERLFGKDNKNIIMIKDPNEIKEWANRLLKDDKLRQKIGYESYKYIHNNLDWYKRLYKILKDGGFI